MKSEDGVDTAKAGTDDIKFARIGITELSEDVSFSDYYIYAKSGYERTGVGMIIGATDGEDVDEIRLQGNMWSNTADEITTMTLTATVEDGMSYLTHYELWRLNL